MAAIKLMLSSWPGFSFAPLCCIIRSGTPFGVVCIFADLIIPKASAFLVSRHQFYSQFL